MNSPITKKNHSDHNKQLYTSEVAQTLPICIARGNEERRPTWPASNLSMSTPRPDILFSVYYRLLCRYFFLLLVFQESKAFRNQVYRECNKQRTEGLLYDTLDVDTCWNVNYDIHGILAHSSFFLFVVVCSRYFTNLFFF